MKKLIKSENKIKSFPFKIKSVDTKNYTVEGVFSAEVEDRHGEIVVQRGWDLENYKKNPVVLWAHRSDEPPIGKMLEIGVNPETNQLEGKIQFAVEQYEFAKTIFNLIVGGYQKAFSAGFINSRYEIDQEEEKIYLVENELLEMSCVPVPANQLSLAKTKGIQIEEYEEKSKGIEEIIEKIDEEDEIDDDDLGKEEKAIEIISKSNIDTIRGAIGTLTEVLKAHDTDIQDRKVETPVNTLVGKNKVSVKLLNKAIKDLLKSKNIIRIKIKK